MTNRSTNENFQASTVFQSHEPRTRLPIKQTSAKSMNGTEPLPFTHSSSCTKHKTFRKTLLLKRQSSSLIIILVVFRIYVYKYLNVPHSLTNRRANSPSSIMKAYLISFADFWMMWNCKWLFHNSNVVYLRLIFYVTIFWWKNDYYSWIDSMRYASKIEKDDSRPKPFQKSKARKGNWHVVEWNEKWTFLFAFTMRRILE